jgi:DNA-binding GntR family transcriptional regulator
MNAAAQRPAALATEILGDLHIQFAAGTTYTRDEIEAQFSAISENAVVQALDILIEAGLVRSPGGSGALVPIERRQHQAPLHDAHVRESHAHRHARPGGVLETGPHGGFKGGHGDRG